MSLVLLIGVDDRTSSVLGGAVPPLMLESARDGRRVLELPPSELELVVVGDAANDPIAAAQHTRAADPAIAVLMLAAPPQVETLRRSILFAPFIGKDVRFVETDDAPAVVAEVRAGLERTRSRRQHRRVLESIHLDSRRAKAPRPIDERTLASFLERAPTGIVSIDARGMIASANRAAWELLGADERALLGTRLRERFDRDARGPLDAWLARVSSGDRDEVLRFERTTDGACRTIEARAVSLSADAAILIVLQDVTRLVDAERSLRRALERQSFLADVAGRLSTSLDRGEIADQAARAIASRFAAACLVDELGPGASRRLAAAGDPGWVAPLRAAAPGALEPAGAGTLAITHTPGDLARVLGDGAIDPALATAIRERGAWVVPFGGERARGRIVLLAPREDASSPEERTLLTELAARLSIALDRAQLVARIDAERERAEEASRAKDEFLAIVSHELRTPLNAVLGWSTLLLAEGRTESQIRRGAETIQRNAAAQARLIEDLLDVSRITTGKLQLEVAWVDPAAILRDAVHSIAVAAAARRVVIETEIAGDAETIRADPGRLQQVLWNLLSNAVRFSDKGGRVRASLRRVGSSLELAVADEGRGISPEFLPHVFERFRQADGSTTREHGGLGLGLAIVQHLVQLHGGHVVAESEGLGRGATFRVLLPIAPVRGDEAGAHPPTSTAIAATARHAALGAHTSLAGIRVLVVDDDPDARGMLEEALSTRGARVVVAASAPEAIAAVRGGAFDVVVSDIGMPGEDGYMFIRALRMLAIEEGGGVPAIALTAYSQASDRARALRSGFQLHLAKPAPLDELARAVLALARSE